LDKSYKPYFCVKSDGVYYKLWDGLKKLYDTNPKTFKEYKWDVLSKWRFNYYHDDESLFYHPMNWEWEKIKNVDFSTFKKIEKSTYEDKNNMYEVIQWRYWFKIETKSKK
jgi:hypothetical protein